MENFIHQRKALFFMCFLLHYIHIAISEPYIGVYVGPLDDKDPSDVSRFISESYIQKVRMHADPYAIMAMSDINVDVAVQIPNYEISYMADSESYCYIYYLKMLSTYDLNQVRTFIVGDKVISSENATVTEHLVSAMKNLQNAIDSAGYRGKIKVSTLVSTDVLMSSSYKPSKAAFKSSYLSVINPLLKFLRDNDSPLMISIFPYHDYLENPTLQILKLCLFLPNSGIFDRDSSQVYDNMFDIMVDSTRHALNGLQYGDIKIVVGETGWPSDGDENEIGANWRNSYVYNTNLVKYLRSNVGTPMMRGKNIDTYIYTLFDDRRQAGPTSMKSCGIIHPDYTWRFNINLDRRSNNNEDID